jgi:hypothetical protein
MVSSMKEIYYVYGHYIKETNKIFYVGKGKGKRAYSKESRNKYWHHITNKHEWDVFFYYKNLNEKDAFKDEWSVITDIKPIANFAEGGLGGNTWKNYPSDLAKIRKNKMSKAMKGKNLGKKNGMFGKKHTKELKEKLSKINIENPTKTRKIKDTETGIVYNQVKKAAEETGFPMTSFRRRIGKRFIYIN